MKRLKTFGIYLLMVVSFYIFSNILIFVGLNTNYDSITNINSLPEQIEIYKAEATAVNGRIKGKINSAEEVKEKYLRVDLYSNTDTLIGTRYYKISEIIKENNEGEFKIYFKSNYIERYNLSIEDEKNEELATESFLDKEMKAISILVLLIKLCF